MGKNLRKLSIFIFTIGFLVLGGHIKEVKAESYRTNYSMEDVSSYQGVSSSKAYYGRTGYINIWDADRSNSLKYISYTLTKNGQDTGDSNSFTAGSYINWCAFPLTIYGTGEYVAKINLTNTSGTSYSGECNFYVYDITPVISSNPSAKTVKSGTSVSFSTSISQGTNVDYQWYYSSDGGSTYNIISGATSSTYTISAGSVTASLNGRYYRCRLSNDNDEGKYVYTTAAKLTVYSAPTVTTPSAKSVKEGTSATFSVTASGGYPSSYTYQWYYASSSSGSGTSISGATSSSYTITSGNMTSALNGRYYYCTVSNGQYNVSSGRVKLTVYSAPTVTTPSAKSIKEGTSATFSVTASGGYPSSYTYQWYYASSSSGSGTSISGATSSSYTITSGNMTSDLNGRYYYCTVSNGQYNVSSGRAKLTVYSAPSVTAPTAKTVQAGTSVTFSVSVSGGNPSSYTYQWYYATSQSGSGTSISGATSSSYTVTSGNMTSDLNGRYYYCIVSNGQYDVTSDRAKLTVETALSVTSPTAKNVKSGTSTTFSVTASGGGTSNYTYQWYYATSQSGTGTRINGATSSSYTIAAASMTTGLNGRYYYCVVSNGSDSVESDRAKLTVYNAPNVTTPTSQNVTAGTSATFSVTASGGNPSSYTYQWYYARSQSGTGTIIIGATASSYTITASNMTSALDGRYYYCIVSNGQYNVTSDRAKLTVYSDNFYAPNVTAPTAQNVKVRESATFSVTASGGNPSTYTYQWYYASSLGGAGIKLTGATSASYTIRTTTNAMNGRYYYCIVSNGQYSTTSGRAKLTLYNNEPLTVSGLTEWYSVAAGSSLDLSVSAIGGITADYTYQWYYAASETEAGTKIDGAILANYTISAAEMTTALNGRYYYCVVSDGTDEVESRRTKIFVYNETKNPGAGGSGQNVSSGLAVQIIEAASYTKEYGSKSFYIQASTNGNGTMTYQSGNRKVAQVSSDGRVKLKGYGTAVITIQASQTAAYQAATKQITIDVIPKKAKLTQVQSSGSRRISLKWKKNKKAAGYEIYISMNKNFKAKTLKRAYPKAKTNVTLIGLQSQKTYYVRIRSYAKAGKKKCYSEWSQTKSVRIK